MKIIQKILWIFSPCRKCKEKDVEHLVACFCTKGLFEKKWKSRYRLSDKVRKQRLKRWICLISQATVFVVGFAIGFFYPQEEPLGLGLVIFAICVLIECIKESE